MISHPVSSAVRHYPGGHRAVEESDESVHEATGHDGPDTELQLCRRAGEAVEVFLGRHPGQGHL